MCSSSVEVLNVRLRRIDLSVPWGFNLQGGREFSSPLMITKVAQNSLADKSLVRPGDYILKIGNRSVEAFTHHDARNAILEQGNDLELTLQRNAIPRPEDYLIHYDFPQHKLMNPESLEPHSGVPTGSPQVGIQLKDNRALLTQSYNSPLGLYSKQNVASTLATTIKNLNIDEKNILSEQTILQNLALTEPPSSSFQSQSSPSSFSNKPVSNNDFPENFSHQNLVRNNEPRAIPSHGGVNKNVQALNFSSGPRNFNRGLKGSAILRAENSQAIVPQCYACGQIIRGPFISAVGKTWCPNHFVCANPSCGVNLENVGFVEENGKLFCERDYHDYFAPKCVKCYKPIVGDTCYALQKAYHPDCFTCAHCNKKIGSTGFHVEDGQPYCLKDYNELFSSKCASCNFPIDAGDRFLEAMNQVFHADCFTCTTCNSKLENVGFVVKANKPYCKRHAMFS